MTDETSKFPNTVYYEYYPDHWFTQLKIALFGLKFTPRIDCDSAGLATDGTLALFFKEKDSSVNIHPACVLRFERHSGYMDALAEQHSKFQEDLKKKIEEKEKAILNTSRDVI